MSVFEGDISNNVFLEKKYYFFSGKTFFEISPLKTLSNFSQENTILHHRKLHNLWRQQRARGSNSIVNLSNKQLSIPEEEVLRFGLDHHVLPQKIDQDTVKISLERLLYSFKNKLHISSIDDETKNEIKYIFRMFINRCKTTM